MVVSCFLDFSCSLRSCVAVFTFEEAITSSSLYSQSSGEKYLPSALLGFLRLSQTFSMDMFAPHFLFIFGREFLRLCAFFWSCKARLGAQSLLFAFPRAVLNDQVCVLLLNPRFRLAFCMCSLVFCKGLLSLAFVACTGSSHGVMVCTDEAHGVLVVHICQFWGSTGEVHDTVNRLCVLLIPSKSHRCCSLSPIQPPSRGAHLIILDGARKKLVSLAASHMLEKLDTHMPSLSPVRGIMGWEGLSWHWPVLHCGRDDVGKIKLFLIPFSMCPITGYFSFFFFLQRCAGTFLLAFHKGTLVHGWVPKLVFFEGTMVENSYFNIFMMSLSHNFRIILFLSTKNLAGTFVCMCMCTILGIFLHRQLCHL